MKKQIVIISGFLLLAASQMSYAQTAPEVDSRKIIDKGIDLHDNKNYDEAINKMISGAKISDGKDTKSISTTIFLGKKDL